ncbi:MAG TPA: LLM class flavin-dependent oxidoreductase [Candidatus Dormibacteraeota bacterium]|nr:LLM class flavin-dependent oxidoreductase [Candidatus Dormibacteraeota bacterium]
MSRPLQVGFQLPEVERKVRWPELAAMARLGEDMGFDSIWVGDHLLYRDDEYGARGPWEAWTQLAGIAAVTRRIALGPLVASTSFHNPPMLAKLAGTVDEISGGRLILGLGAGWNEVEYTAFGFPFDRRISRFAEAFTIIRSLIREGRVDFQGEFYRARDCELVPRARSNMPFLIGSTGKRMLEIAVPYVDAWNAWYRQTGNQPEGVDPLRETVDAACRAAGRNPREVERTVAVLIEMPGSPGRKDIYESGQEVKPLRGNAEQIAEELRKYAGHGVGHVQLIVDPINEKSLEALAPVLEILDR